MSIEFETAPIPTVTRTAGPNPLDPAVQAAVEQMQAGTGLGVKFTIPLVPGDTDASEKEIKRHRRLLDNAAEQHGVTIRKSVLVGGTAKAPTAEFHIWAIARIVQNRKPTE